MAYPLILSSFNNDLEIFIPDRAAVKPVYEELRANNPSTPFPFWAKIWASAKALSLFLAEHPELTANKNVLEIGAGIGLPSFTMAKQAASVIISDHNADAVALLEKNIEQLALTHVKAIQLDWNDFPATLTADVVLLSDVNYSPDQFENLLALLHRFLNQGTTIILATPQRMMGAGFVQELESFVKSTHEFSIQEGEGETHIRILLLAHPSIRLQP